MQVFHGNGKTKGMDVRMADLGRAMMTPDLHLLRRKCLETMQEMAEAIYPGHITDPFPDRAGQDAIMAELAELQKVIRKRGFNVVWVEKCKIMAAPKVFLQWQKGQNRLFGKFKNISSRSEKAGANGIRRLVNLPEEYSERLSESDVRHLNQLADGMEYGEVMEFLRELREDDMGLSSVQADALRAMMERVNQNFSCPEWKDDGIVQLHLDNRAIRGEPGKANSIVLKGLLTDLTDQLLTGVRRRRAVEITAVVQRQAPIRLSWCVPERISKAYSDSKDQVVTSIVIELGSDRVVLKGAISRPKKMTSPVGHSVVIGEDFGYRTTSSMVVMRSKSPIAQEAVARVAEIGSGKEKAKAYLEASISGDDVEVVETVQFSGKGFLDSVARHSKRIDALRREIDLNYERLDRVREEINRLLGREIDALIEEEPLSLLLSNTEKDRYMRMHGRFFRIFAGLGKLKAKRKAIYATIAGIKKTWLGHVANAKIRLAEKYGAVVVYEDLDNVTIELDDPKYRGRTFNKMINNGARGQYNRRSEQKMDWRGIPRLKIPSFYTSSTDWRSGHVDKDQRNTKTNIFTALDGSQWEADLHAGEMIARWPFLRPKLAQENIALT